MIGEILGFFLLAVFVPLLVSEAGDLAPSLARWLIRWGARRVGQVDEAGRYEEEWLADLERVPGKVTKLAHACGVLAVSVPRLRAQFRRSSQGALSGFWGLLSEAERAALQALGRDTVFRAGDTVCAEGYEATDVLVLTEGWVKILSATRKHRDTVLALRGRGDIVGEPAGNSTGYGTAAVVAVSPVKVLVLAHETFSLFLDSNPGADRAYRHATTQRWREAADILRSRSVNNGTQRLAGLVLDLAARHGTPAGAGTAITIPLSQEEIASLIDTSRATVTRALGDWRRGGLIGTARQQITINSTPGLRSIAGRDTVSAPPVS
jgi:CRP/FNR family cyclic AMP-dependent transcriptional regulator